jgi:two-component system sensor histidine kinase/response regulator
MGGGVGVKSEPGRGSTFFFTARLGRGEASGRTYVPQPDLRERRLLVVDDNPLAVHTLSEMLRSMTFRVEDAASGEEALAAIVRAERSSDPFAIVFLDWRMPGLDGIETARRIAAMPLTAPPRRVLVTAYGREEVFHEAESAGFDGIIVKPVSPSLLFDAAIRALGGEAWRAENEVIPAPHPETSDVGRLQGARVLLVEDNELNQQVAFELLGAAGMYVELAENGEQGLRRVQEHSYDLVLMDLQMPVMDGFEATRRIRHLPAFRTLPILAMTANAMAGDRERSLVAGMNDHITKPIDPDELFDVLLRWLPTRAAGAEAEHEASVRPAPTTESASPRDLGVDLPLETIAGLDVADGLRRVLGRREAYVGLLRRFAETQGQVAMEIRSALRDGRRADAERAAHTLKGVAGSIGARQLQREAADIETALRQGTTVADVEPLLGPAERTLDGLVAALVSALPSESEATTAPPVFDRDGLAAVVEQLEQLLSQDSVEAIAAFEAARPLLSTAFGDRAGRIGKLIKGYRFEDALSALREVASNSGGEAAAPRLD